MLHSQVNHGIAHFLDRLCDVALETRCVKEKKKTRNKATKINKVKKKRWKYNKTSASKEVDLTAFSIFNNSLETLHSNNQQIIGEQKMKYQTIETALEN